MSALGMVTNKIQKPQRGGLKLKRRGIDEAAPAREPDRAAPLGLAFYSFVTQGGTALALG